MQSKFSSIYKYYSEIKREIHLPLRYATLTFLWLVLWLICASIMLRVLKLYSRHSKYEYQKSCIFPRFFYLLLYQKTSLILIGKNILKSLTFS